MIRGALLLHICCAPDATVPIRDLKAEGWTVTGCFYGSNIHPETEYRRRAEALCFLAEQEGIPVVMRPYAPEQWLAQVSHLAEEPEGGLRCSLCLGLQLRVAGEEAARLGASRFSTTLTVSPRKDVALISRLGAEVAASLGLTWEGRVWRKKNGFLRSLQISRELGLYRQNHCGCAYDNVMRKPTVLGVG
jgi:predicted adenine nucleotide alpha hydrolase (AANH) superfamily ATPase